MYIEDPAARSGDKVWVVDHGTNKQAWVAGLVVRQWFYLAELAPGGGYWEYLVRLNAKNANGRTRTIKVSPGFIRKELRKG